MKGRLLGLPLLVLGCVAVSVPTALAVSPHFISTSASVTSSGQLSVSWKEAGLGDNMLITYTLSADASATWACFNNGGHNPEATNKQTTTTPESTSGTFPSGKNGSISGTLTLNPPGPGSFSCPSGQHLVLAMVSYTDVSLSDGTITAPISGTFSKTFVTL